MCCAATCEVRAQTSAAGIQPYGILYYIFFHFNIVTKYISFTLQTISHNEALFRVSLKWG
jgi:hypothetical protein